MFKVLQAFWLIKATLERGGSIALGPYWSLQSGIKLDGDGWVTIIPPGVASRDNQLHAGTSCGRIRVDLAMESATLVALLI